MELLFIFVLALLVLGPKRLPEVGRTVGKLLAEFKRATNSVKDSIECELRNAQIETEFRRDAREPNTIGAGKNIDGSKS